MKCWETGSWFDLHLLLLYGSTGKRYKLQFNSRQGSKGFLA